jgi:hypothetical protein
MAENTKGINPKQERDRKDSSSREDLQQSTGQPRSGERSDASSLNEKSSTMGRRDKGRGLSSKDGLTGSDYDGQVTD